MPASRPSSRYDPPLPTSWVVTRRRSRIHGQGVYARVDIPAGYVIVEYRGEKITKAESSRREAARLARVRAGEDACTYSFWLNRRYDLDARRWGNISRHINHACEPSCRAEKHRGRIWIIADRDIRRGEEITFDYGFRFKHWRENPCRCGSPRCVGYIVAADQRWRLRSAGTRSAHSPHPGSVECGATRPQRPEGRTTPSGGTRRRPR